MQGLSFAAALRAHEASAVLFTDCKSGFRGRADGTVVSTLINSAHYPDPYPERGIHKFTLGVGVAQGCKKQLESSAVSFARRLVWQTTDCHAGTLPTSGALWQGCVKRVVIYSVAPLEDGLAIRIGTPTDKEGIAAFTFEKPVRSAAFVDLFGKPTDLPAPHINEDTVTAAIPSCRILTLKICF